jgi:hypothetical protein
LPVLNLSGKLFQLKTTDYHRYLRFCLFSRFAARVDPDLIKIIDDTESQHGRQERYWRTG